MSAKNMFYAKNKKFSDVEERALARQRLIFNVTEDLLVIMEDESISKADLARLLGKSKSYVSQILSGARNMTLGSLSDICFSLGFKPRIELPVREEESIYKTAVSTSVVSLEVIRGKRVEPLSFNTATVHTSLHLVG
jgi:transcriptional regulator with XRE-family HTH domain